MESAAATTITTGSPSARARLAPYGRRSNSAATTISATRARVAVVPCPGARAKKPVTVSTAPKPTAGSSHDQESRPDSARTARPTSNEAAQINAAET